MNCSHKNVNVITYVCRNYTIGHQLKIFFIILLNVKDDPAAVIPAN